MSRFQSLFIGGLVVSQLMLPLTAQASSKESGKETTKVTNFTLPANFFFPTTTKSVATPTPTPSPSSTAKSTTKYTLPVIVTFKPVVTSVPVAPKVTPTATPSATPMVVATKAPVKEVALPQDKKDTIKRFYESMQSKLSDLSDKLSNLAARMDTKVAELKTKGISTIAIEKALTAAKAKIALAKTDLADASSKANALLDSADRKLAFDALKVAVLDVQNNLKTAHELLTEAANQLKTAYQTLPAVKAN